MTTSLLAKWLLAIMLSAVPPGHSRSPKEAKETEEAGRTRYKAIATAVATATLDAKEGAIFHGDHAREKTAAMLLAISYHESHWRRHIDLGLGKGARSRRYHCMMQIAVDKKKTREGWTKDELYESRDKCFRAGLHILQYAEKRCRKHGPEAFLNLYGSGSCTRGRKAAKKRFKTLYKWLEEHPFPKAEKDPKK